MNRKCWAAPLGDCSEKMTGEHVISKNLFSDNSVYVQGFPWCKDEPKLIGLPSLTANVLCKTHNSALSDTDSAVKQCKKAFEDAVKLMNFRMQYGKTHWTRRRFEVNGAKFEAWFVKTLINCAYQAKHPIGQDASEPGRPSLNLIEAAFGLRRLERPMGVYVLPVIGQNTEITDRVNLITLITPAQRVGGAIAQFGNLRYLLNLLPSEPTANKFVGELAETVKSSNFMYHLRQSRFMVHGNISHTIDFRW